MPSAVETWFGPAFASLHPQLQALHRNGGALSGSVQLTFGTGIAGRIGRRLARNLGVPETSGEHQLEVSIHSADGVLHWDRRFDGGSEFCSTFTPHDRFPSGLWVEASGRIQLLLGVQIIRGSWHWEHRGSRLGALPLPRALLPRTTAYKEVVDQLYHFQVMTAVPGLGAVLQYAANSHSCPLDSTCSSLQVLW